MSRNSCSCGTSLFVYNAQYYCSEIILLAIQLLEIFVYPVQQLA